MTYILLARIEGTVKYNKWTCIELSNIIRFYDKRISRHYKGNQCESTVQDKKNTEGIQINMMAHANVKISKYFSGNKLL